MSNYRLTIRSLPSAVPSQIRLRRLLKVMLRTFNFRCVAVEVIENNDQAGEISTEPPTTATALSNEPRKARRATTDRSETTERSSVAAMGRTGQSAPRQNGGKKEERHGSCPEEENLCDGKPAETSTKTACELERLI
jgi:hypothetical protein